MNLLNVLVLLYVLWMEGVLNSVTGWLSARTIRYVNTVIAFPASSRSGGVTMAHTNFNGVVTMRVTCRLGTKTGQFWHVVMFLYTAAVNASSTTALPRAAQFATMAYTSNSYCGDYEFTSPCYCDAPHNAD